jgi:hypothetical protein
MTCLVPLMYKDVSYRSLADCFTWRRMRWVTRQPRSTTIKKMCPETVSGKSLRAEHPVR